MKLKQINEPNREPGPKCSNCETRLRETNTMTGLVYTCDCCGARYIKDE